MDGDDTMAQQSWQHLLSLEKDTALAGQAHFGLAGIYRKQGKAADAAREMEAESNPHKRIALNTRLV